MAQWFLTDQGLVFAWRIAFIDTERGSGEVYSHLGDYDICTLTAPFTPNKYIEAIRVAVSPLQREGVEHEFAVFLELDHNHLATATKDITGLFDGQVFKPTVQTGKTLANWLAGEQCCLNRSNCGWALPFKSA